MEERLNEIKALYQAIELHVAEEPRRALVCKRKFEKEIDLLLHELEDIYYSQLIKKKPVNELQNEIERSIVNTRKTLNTFLPYMMMYNLAMQEPPS